MPYHLLPNIVFLLAILGILLIILRHLPKAAAQDKASQELPVEEKLSRKGLPAEAFSKLGLSLKFLGKKIWNFLLEAKDLKPGAVAGYKIKKLFNQKLPAKTELLPVATVADVRDEKFYLEEIKKQPKNLELYAELGKFYLDKENYADAKDIFQYLTNHTPTNPEYYARLALSYYKLSRYDKAVDSYQKSIALDSTQPNRYYNLGRSLEALGNFESAINALEQAIVLEPKNEKYYISLSSVQMKLGNRNDAKVTLRKAKKNIPGSQVILGKLKDF